MTTTPRTIALKQRPRANRTAEAGNIIAIVHHKAAAGQAERYVTVPST